jgi:hypothetical protein
MQLAVLSQALEEVGAGFSHCRGLHDVGDRHDGVVKNPLALGLGFGESHFQIAACLAVI